MGDVTEDDVGKPIVTAEEREIGTLRGIDGPTLHIAIAEDVDDELLSDMKIAETTSIRDADGGVLAGAARASVADVTDDTIHFWPAYATEARHESVSYEEIPGADSNVDPEES
ncbi:hypothetical protein BRC90_07835 [Halobacteriales archaeon QS_4_69_34]|nr:MAG: hypothetical protein BRC90_07835 [Halobacteriales archaeon QS_4_69_34]